MIRINIDKAKTICHEKRREERAKEFQPYDEVISKQIPGNDFNEAELARQHIRDKYAGIQEDIDEAADVDTLKSILSQWD